MRVFNLPLLIMLLLVAGVVLGPENTMPRGVHAQSLPVVSVFNSIYGSSNVTDTTLTPGNQTTFDITVSGAPAFNAFELFLYYDPAYINATSFDLTTGTVFSDGSPANLVSHPLSPAGTVHLAVANFHNPASFTGVNGILTHIVFKILRVGVSPLVLAPGIAGTTDQGTVLVTDITPILVRTSDGYFKNIADRSGPVASFTFTPPSPAVGEAVIFNASTSFDPDSNGRGINRFIWQFGVQGIGIVTNETTIAERFNSGNFSVRLTVVDTDDGFEGMVDLPMQVSSQTHDIAVTSVTTAPFNSARVGQNVTVFVTVADQGTFEEQYNLTVSYGIASPTTMLAMLPRLSIFPGTTSSFSFLLRTGGLSPGTYTITARADVSIDDNPGNNMASAFITLTAPVVDTPPLANFTFSPAHPHNGDLVAFSGFSSSDPDGFVQAWLWNFGDGSPSAFGPLTNHVYSTAGNFTVTLTVTDNGGLTARTSKVVQVVSRPLHDVGIMFLDPEPSRALSGRRIRVFVGLVNNGLSTETVDVTVYYDSHVAGVLRGVSLPAVNSSCSFCSGAQTIVVPWDTSGVPAGNYTLSAAVPLASDQSPADNTFVDGTVDILPPPTITVTPDSGALGTQVVVHGFNFPEAQFGPPEVDISFDDQFIGFITIQGSSFNFTFNVPHADPNTPHRVHARMFFPFNLDVQTGFTVLPEPPPSVLSLSASAASVYFPGETATIFLLTSLNGSPVGSGVQLSVQLFRPDGSMVSLNVVAMSTGIYTATYTVPRIGSTGTYAVVAKASRNGLAASALGSFEVKPPWISSQSGRMTTTALALVGIVGLAAVATWIGRGNRKREPFSSDL